MSENIDDGKGLKPFEGLTDAEVMAGIEGITFDRGVDAESRLEGAIGDAIGAVESTLREVRASYDAVSKIGGPGMAENLAAVEEGAIDAITLAVGSAAAAKGMFPEEELMEHVGRVADHYDDLRQEIGMVASEIDDGNGELRAKAVKTARAVAAAMGLGRAEAEKAA